MHDLKTNYSSAIKLLCSLLQLSDTTGTNGDAAGNGKNEDGGSASTCTASPL